MNKIVSGLLATVLSISFVGAEMLPVNAASIYVPQTTTAISSEIVPVVDRGGGNFNRGRVFRHGSRNSWSGNRSWNGNRNYRGGGRGYWNGHRGSSYYRRGYRRHGNLWFPLAAFATGAIISGAIANDRPPAYSGNSHVQYCYNRYKSYRASDNTFQPYNGPRQQCR